MKVILLSLLFFCFINSGQSQTQPQEITKKFFDIYNLKNTDQAIDYLFSNTAYAEDIKEGIEDLKRQLKKQVGQIGLYYGSDLLSTKSAGPNVIMYTYLVRHAVQPLTFHIMFYKPHNKWQMQSFKYNNNTSDDLEEAAKLYRLKENFE